MASFNQYVRIYEFDVHVLIYNTINGETIILPKEYINGNEISELLAEPVREYLQKYYFSDRALPWDKFQQCFESTNRLLISLETSLACNLSCPYCYQINNTYKRTKISKKNLDLLFEYIVKVHQKVSYEILVLKILGGEPSLDWSPSDYFLQKILPFCHSNKIKLDLRIDTNCTNISELKTISGYDSILFTIPLCNKKQHDIYRRYANGQGTYDSIIENIRILQTMHNCSIVLRHNTDSYNIATFGEYIKDISSIGLKDPIIMPQFTTNPEFGEFENQLSYTNYVKWLSTECIDILVMNNFNVHILPRLALWGKCQQWSKYSLKLFSDGRVGACAAHFFDDSNPHISDIMNNGIESIETYWGRTKTTDIFNDEKCRSCKSFFGCSGHYKLPCIKEFNIDRCRPEENLYLDWQHYFKTIYRHVIEGNQKYIPGLKIKVI